MIVYNNNVPTLTDQLPTIILNTPQLLGHVQLSPRTTDAIVQSLTAGRDHCISVNTTTPSGNSGKAGTTSTWTG